MNSALWQTVLGEIELTISRGSFTAWFKHTKLLEYDENTAIIAVPNIFAKQQLEVKFNTQIMQTMTKNGANVKKINYTIESANKKQASEIAKQMMPARAAAHSRPEKPKEETKLNPRYNFDTFIVGSCNDLAYTACQAVAANPGTKYNPLYLYGGVGLGKTHLIQAVGNEIAQQKPDIRILYTTTEAFVSNFLDSIRFKKAGFSDKYRNVDVLIVDDMQFIANKEKTQEEFFHTFNALYQDNKQIIISSDRQPKSIPTLTDRLRSRFEWGMAIDLQMPDFETRSAILQTKAAQSGFQLDKDVVEFLATRIQTNIRELEGSLNQLLAFCEMRGQTPDVQIASELLGNNRVTRPHYLTIKQVIERTAKHFQIEPSDIVSAKRDKHIVVPRQIAMYLLRSELHLSFPKIAVELGRKDHTTAIHSVEKINNAVKLDHVMRQHVNEIKEKLYA